MGTKGIRAVFTDSPKSPDREDADSAGQLDHSLAGSSLHIK
jgi:hypothetical protein